MPKDTTEQVKISPAQRVDIVVEDGAQLSRLFEISTKTRFEAAVFIPTTVLCGLRDITKL